MTPQHLAQIKELLDNSTKVVLIQADNPDGDSLATTLALEQILAEAGKTIYMYCSVDMPEYLRWNKGWDRVEQTYPGDYDVAIMVDNSSDSLLRNLTDTGKMATLKQKPLIIIDHHPTATSIDYADVYINDPKAASSGQLVYLMAKELDLPLDKTSASLIATSILSDTLGFNSQIMLGNPKPLNVMAELVELGVDLADLNDRRTEHIRIEQELVPYRGQLLQRIEFVAGQQIATITIPHQEIKDHSIKYNPTVILDEMRLVRGVKIGIGFKTYQRGGKGITRVTARIRCNRGCEVAQDLAEHFGGGGHPYASGIKWEGKDLDIDDIKQQVFSKTSELLQAESNSKVNTPE